MYKSSFKHRYGIRFVRWITIKNRRYYAQQYGITAFPIKVRK